MALDRAAKEKLGFEAADRFEKANAAMVAEFRGMTVGELTELRVSLRKSGAEFRVIKNRAAKKGIEAKSEKSKAILGDLKGPIGIVFAYNDAAAAAKAVLNFAKDHENFKVKSAVMDGRKLSASDLKAIADLPSREVLLATVASMLSQPAQKLVGALAGKARSVYTVLNGLKDKKTS